MHQQAKDDTHFRHCNRLAAVCQVFWKFTKSKRVLLGARIVLAVGRVQVDVLDHRRNTDDE
jgi:hypothetical protein